jgi:hypothetical protein
MGKKFALYAYGSNKELSDYYFMELFWYVHDKLETDLSEASIFVDTGNFTPQKEELMNRLDEFKAIITPAYWHFNNSYDLYKDYYEKKFINNGIYVICLNEEDDEE